MWILRCELGLVIGILLAAPVIGGWPPDVITFAYWQDGGANVSRSEVFRNLGLFAVAAVGFVVASRRSYIAYLQSEALRQQAATAIEQARISEQGQVTERFSKAVELLGNLDSVMVRTGAVYALGRIAQDSIERDHIAVMQVLCQFVRHSPYAARVSVIGKV